MKREGLNKLLKAAGILLLALFNGSGIYAQCEAVIGSNIDPLEGCEVLTIQFYDRSTDVLSRTWDFGDGSEVSLAQNPVHSFTAGESDTVYTVTLTITCASGTSSTSKNVTVFAKPKINFGSDKSSVCAITDSVCLTNLSDYHPSNTYSWIFNDGTISEDFEPCKIYSTPGTYSTTLTVSNEHGCLDTYTREDFIKVEPVPSTAFSVSGYSGCSPFTVEFENITDTIGEDYSNWTWDFGDESEKVYGFETPSHTFTSPGVYTVTLGATNSLGCYNYSTQIITVRPSPVARFTTSTPDCQNENTFIEFTGSYNSTPDFSWALDSGRIVSGSGEGPIEVRWPGPGIKDIKLTINEDGCSSSYARKVEITPIARVYLHISASADTVCSGQPVTFTASPENFLNYNFFKNDVLVKKSFNNTYIDSSFNDGDVVYVKITDNNGCSEIISDTVRIHVKDTPEISIFSSASNNIICSSDALMFNIEPDLYDEYAFYLNNIEVQSGASSTYIIGNPEDNDRVYARAVDNECASRKSNTIITAVKEASPPPVVYCGKTTATGIEFRWDPIPDAVEYQVSIDNGPFGTPGSGELGLTHELTGLSEFETHTISVRAVEDTICAYTLTSDVVSCQAINCTPIEFEAVNPVREVCEGENVGLEIKNVSIPDYSIAWDNGTPAADHEFSYTAATGYELPVSVINEAEPDCPAVTKYFTIDVTEKRQVDLISSAGGEVCQNDEVVLKADPADMDRYEFYDNDLMVQSGFEPLFTVPASSSGHHFYVKAYDDACLNISDTLVVSMTAPLDVPVVSFKSSTESSVTFEWDPVEGATGYIVSRDNGEYTFPSDVTQGLSHTISSLTSGQAVTLSVIALSDNPCGNSNPSQPAVGYAENCTEIDFNLQDKFTICSGDTVIPEIKNLSISDYLVSWGNLPASRSLMAVLAPSKDTLVPVRITNLRQPGCSDVLKYVKINVTLRPDTLLLSNDIPGNEVCPGNTVRFTASPGGYDSYEFYNYSELVYEGPFSSYSLLADEGNYSLKARALEGNCAGEFSNVVEKKVIEPLKVPQVNCGSSTENSLSFTWDSVPGATGYMVSINGGDFTDPSTGSMGIIHEMNGFSAYDSASIRVMAVGNIDCVNSLPSQETTCYARNCHAISFTIDPYHEICENEQLNLEVSSVTPVDYSIRWSEGSWGNETAIAYTGEKDTVITVELLDNGQPQCPAVSKAFEIDVHNPEAITVISDAPNDTICEGERVTFTVEPGDFERFAFYNNETLLRDSSLNTFTTKNLPADNNIYVRAFRDGCYSESETKHVEIIRAPELRLSANLSGNVCINEEAEISASEGFSSYSFSNLRFEIKESMENVVSLNIRDSVITASATDNHGCISLSPDTLRFNLLSLPQVSLSCSVDTICYREYASYHAYPEGLAEYRYFLNDELLQSSSSNYYSTDSLETGDRISVVGIDSNRCSSSPFASDFPEILPYPGTVITAGKPGLCLGDSMMLSYIADTAFPDLSYYWSTGQTGDTIRIAPVVTENYELLYSDALCSGVRVDEITIPVDNDPPPVAYAGEDVEICINDSIMMAASGGMSYRWNNIFSVSNPDIPDPYVFPLETTTYVVTVTNTFCTDNDSVRVIVDLCLEDLPADIPQIITPNGDGINDNWEISNVDYFTGNSLRIFNRWGNEVFSASPYENNWNGKSQSGAELPDGTYFFILELGNGVPAHTGYIIIHR